MRYSTFAQGAKRAGLDLVLAADSAHVLRLAGRPVTHDGLMADSDVEFLTSWHERAYQAFQRFDNMRSAGWSYYHQAGEWLAAEHPELSAPGGVT